jgi:hypothetical protein
MREIVIVVMAGAIGIIVVTLLVHFSREILALAAFCDGANG